MRPLCLLLLFPLLATAAPSPDEPLKTLRPEHPRLFATSADWERLKKEIPGRPELGKWHRDLLRQAGDLLTRPAETYRIPDGKRLLTVSRSVLTRVKTLAYAFRMTGDVRYRERLWTELDAVGSFPDWNPRHFLDTAEMTHAVAVGYDWLHADWSPERRARLREMIVTMGLTPFTQAKSAWWKTCPHNWNQVCNGGITVGALAVADEVPDIAGPIVRDGLLNIGRAMASYAPDGGWGEGPGYWHYATSYAVWYLAALESALGSDFGVAAATGFDLTALYPIHLTGPTGRPFNFADAHDREYNRGPVFFWLARRFQLPVSAAFAARTGKPDPLDLLWYASTDGTLLEKLPTDMHFKGVEVVTMRNSWTEPKALYAGFKAGANDVNHSNLDLGTFILEAGGVRWAVDLGGDDYNLPGYFGKQRWDYYRMRAEGHNTLVINPGAGPDQDPKAVAPITTFERGADGARVTADLTAAYPGVDKVTRTLRRIGGRAVEVSDDIAPRGPAEVFWFMHTKASIELAPDGRSALLREAGRTLRVKLAEGPADLRFTTMSALPLSSSPNPPGQRDNKGVTKLALRHEARGEVSWTVRMELEESGNERAAGQKITLPARNRGH